MLSQFGTTSFTIVEFDSELAVANAAIFVTVEMSAPIITVGMSTLGTGINASFI